MKTKAQAQNPVGLPFSVLMVVAFKASIRKVKMMIKLTYKNKASFLGVSLRVLQ